MPREIVVFDLLFPTLFAVFVVAVGAHVLIDLLLARLGVFRWIWHPQLFRIALFFCLFCGVSLLIYT
ncbi:MAG: DUF1656 domain-containing protein [Betaproteobacteria bacterium]|nr:DUF1656 domain-containing protein [Betaproteobacteria bacterium]